MTADRIGRPAAALFAAMMLVFALYAIDILLDPLSVGASQLLQQIATPLVFLGAAVLCVFKSRASLRERTEWRLLALAMVLWGAGSAYFAIFLWYREVPPAPSIADALWIAFYVPAYLAILGLVRKRVGTFGRAVWLDALIGVLGVGGAAAMAVLNAVLEGTSGTTAAAVTNIAYPIADVGLAALLVAALTGLGWRSSGVLRWVAPAFVLFAVADSLYFVQVANGSYEGGGVADLGWPLAALLVGLAAWRADSTLPAGARSSPVVGVPEMVGVAALAVLVFDHFNRVGATVIVLATTSLLAILVRLYLTVRENGVLLERSTREAMTDALTGLGNRRQLTADLAAHAGRLQASRPLEVTLFDLDGFKQYNDTFGHPAGDQLLARLGTNLAQLVAGFGNAYRMGGDEFCAVWNTWDANVSGVTVADAAAALSEQGEAFSIRCSFGTVTMPAETIETEEALRLADSRMYVHKGSGRASAGRQSSDVLQRALVERDSALAAHVGGVADLAAATAVRLGVSTEDRDLAVQTARLHDIGKVAIPDDVLHKAGALDDAEWAFMRRHTVIGERILSAAPALAAVAKLVRATHEAFDGGGYPDGLSGDDIPLIARIVAVCDAYDAMVADRAYRPPRSSGEAVAELRRCSGTQFDPRVVEAFAAVLAVSAAALGAHPRPSPAMLVAEVQEALQAVAP